MPFIDRQLKPLTESEWKARYTDPAYATVRSDELDPATRVETCRVGWVSRIENPPRPFLVRVAVRGEAGWAWGGLGVGRALVARDGVRGAGGARGGTGAAGPARKSRRR